MRLLRARSVTIIRLAPASRPGSSDLPEGSSFRATCAAQEGARFVKRTQRAGPALPSYLVLHRAGFAMPATLLAPRWALTPPFHPYLRGAPLEDIPKVFLRAITGIRSAGGIFSVALSVNSSTGFSLRSGHRLKSVLPLPWRYQARCPTPLSRSGVRTFLPPGCLRNQASDHPAHPPFSLYPAIPCAHRREEQLRLFRSEQLLEFGFGQDWHPQFLGFVVF